MNSKEFSSQNEFSIDSSTTGQGSIFKSENMDSIDVLRVGFDSIDSQFDLTPIANNLVDVNENLIELANHSFQTKPLNMYLDVKGVYS
jgi:hypothetical protein